MIDEQLEIQERLVRALRELDRAIAESSAEPLQDALAAEQDAYQALLELREREFQVARANQQQGGSPQGGNRANAR